jgi:hypothetical protein
MRLFASRIMGPAGMRGYSDLARGNLDGDYSYPRGGVPSKGGPGVARGAAAPASLRRARWPLTGYWFPFGSRTGVHCTEAIRP